MPHRQVNYLSHWLLVRSLTEHRRHHRPDQKATVNSCRAVLLSSCTHTGGRFNFKDLQVDLSICFLPISMTLICIHCHHIELLLILLVITLPAHVVAVYLSADVKVAGCQLNYVFHFCHRHQLSYVIDLKH